MQSYFIEYHLRGSFESRSIMVDAKDIQSAKLKIGRKHGYKSGRQIEVEKVTVIGYF